MTALVRLSVFVAAVAAFAWGGLLPAAAEAAERVTYYEHVAPILQEHCVSCHQPAGQNIGSLVAPMSLQTYEEARPWARSIARKVKAKEMPPWFADAPKGVFTNERGLSNKEISAILTWVDSGAPAGDKAVAPPRPVVSANAESGGYSLGKPDLIVKMPRYFVNDDAQDVQGTFHVKLTDDLLPRDVTVRAWEFRAGTYLARQDTVHHMCGGVLDPGDVPSDELEGKGAGNLALGCIAGGAEPQQLPDGFGRDLKKGSTIIFNMHYYKQAGAGTGYWNEAEIGFYLVKEPVRYKVRTKAIGTFGFDIPPQKINHRVGAAETLEKDTYVLAYWPHAHLRATAARYVATYPDGRKEVLLNVPRYDQSWQVTYKLREPKLLPKGTRIDVDMMFDNSADRGAKRQFNPNLPIQFGARTQDEMMLGFLSYAEVEQKATTQQQ
ncbi:MAG: cytochrome c [Acidimicrobiia bacterium]|nr:cytochrome c [Acidimicrobiia bacterium]